MLAASERGIWFLLDGVLSREYALASSISTFLLKHSTIKPSTFCTSISVSPCMVYSFSFSSGPSTPRLLIVDVLRVRP